MKLYNINTDKLEEVNINLTDDPIYLVDEAMDAHLNSIGLYKVIDAVAPDERYFSYVEDNSLIDNEYVIGYTVTELDVDDVRRRLADELRVTSDEAKRRPRIATGLGYDIWGGREDIAELKDHYDNAEDQILDADDEIQDITGAEYGTIATAVKAYRANLFAIQKTKVTQLKNITTIAQCIEFEL